MGLLARHQLELQASAWPAAGEPVTGHKVIDLPTASTQGRSSEHVYSQLQSDEGGFNRHIELWDLADGRHRVFDPPGDGPGGGWGAAEGPAAISDAEMLVELGTNDLIRMGSHGLLTMTRVQLDALPTVTP